MTIAIITVTPISAGRGPVGATFGVEQAFDAQSGAVRGHAALLDETAPVRALDFRLGRAGAARFSQDDKARHLRQACGHALGIRWGGRGDRDGDVREGRADRIAEQQHLHRRHQK